MPSSNSWKQAYLLQADRLMSGIENTGNPDTITAADIANADFRKKLKASPVSLRQPDYQGPEAQAGNELDARVKAGGFDGFLAQTEKVANTPVIKEALNVLSTGAYATANTADNVLDGARELRDGNLRGISDIAMALPTGLAQGVNAGIGQSKEDATLWGDVIKHGITDLGRDPNSDGNKWVEGIGGFVGDVALDPTTYLTLGGTAIAKGAVQGAKEASKGAKSLAEQMLKDGTKAGGDVFREGSATGTTVAEVAANKHNPLSSAVLGSIRAEKNWREAQRIAKESRRAAKNDTTPVKDLTDQFVGTNVKDFHASTVANQAATDAPAMAHLNSNILDDTVPINLDDTVPINAVDDTVHPQHLPVAETPSMTKLMDEVMQHEVTPVVEKPIVPEPVKPAANELEAAIKNEPIVKAPDLTNSEKVMELQGQKLAPFNEKFQTTQYRNKDLATALTQPDWSPALAEKFKLKAEHRNLSPQEIGAIKRPMTDAEIKRFINKEEDGLNRAEMRDLRALTGESTKEAIANKFIAMRNDHAKYVAGKKAATSPVGKKGVAPKAKQPTREDTINKIIDSHPVKPTAENIAQAQKDATEAAQAVVDHPDALNEVVQHSHRVEEFQASIQELGTLGAELLRDFGKGITTDANEGVRAGAQIIKNAAHSGVVESMKVQFKEAPFMTNKGFRTLTEDKLTGGSWKPERWGSNSQIKLYDTIMAETLRINPRLNSKFDAFKRRRFFMAAMKIADKELRAMGVEPFLNHIDTAGKFVVNLSAYDILRSLEEVDPMGLQNLLFGGQRNGYMLTQLQGAVESMIKLRHSGADEEKVIRSIRSNLLNSQAKNGRPLSNDAASVGVRDANTGRLSGAGGLPLGTGATRAKLDAAIRAGVPKEKAIIEQGRNTVKLSELIADPRVYQKLNYNMLVNHAAHASKLGEEVSNLAESTIAEMVKMAQMGGPGAVLQRFKEIRDGLTKDFNKADFETARLGFDTKMAGLVKESERYVIDTANKRAAISAKPKAVNKAEKAADNVPDILPNGKPSHVENGKKAPVAEPKQEVVNASHAEDAAKAEASAKALIEEAKLVPENVISPNVVDQTVDLMAASVSQAAFRKLHPIEALVNPALGLSENTLRAINSGSHSIARQQAHFHETLDMHLRRYTPDQLATDFKRLQELGRDASRRANGAILIGDEPTSVKELYGIIGTMMEVSAKNVFARNAIGSSHFNKLAQANGLPEMWRFDPAKNAVENGHLWTEWQGIEEKGIQDFLSRMHSITIKASQEIAIAADFSMRFGSKTNTGDLVKIVWKNKKENNASFYDLIDKNLYYPREISGQIVAMDRLMAESRSISPKNPFGRFIINVFDPITNALKASQTTVRPGHWVISVIGDLLRNQIAGVNSIQPYKHAVEIMRAGKLDPESFIGRIDSAEALAKYRKSQEIASGFMATGKGKGAVLHIGGEKVNVSYDTLYQLMNDVVMLPKHRGAGGVLEDRFVGEAVTSRFAHGLEKATDAVTNNSKFSLNELAAKRDNLMRIAMAIDFASKRQFKDLREMKSAMEGQITKWAPTSTDMTGFEAKYVRRTMLYYTWLRGITPRMIDSAMTRPGVTTMVPKALYNWAQATGLNPESIGNPFPEDDGLFPSYYYNNVLGPQWKDDFGMWGINPSSPVIEVANTFSRINPGDPVGNVTGTASQLLGMSTPFIKMPTELAMGANSTGIPVTDPAQYLLDNLGGSYVGALSRATGKTLNQNGIVDRTDSAAKATPEDQAAQAKLQAFNFLTGLKLTDFKSQSAQRAALYDQKDALKTEATNLRRSQ